LPPPADALLRTYLDAVASFNPPGRLATYPGSPLLARELRRDARAKAVEIDGWTALTAYVPPNERRGLVVADPPFEQDDDFAQLARGLAAAHRKWPTGIYLLWYPVKDAAAVTGFVRRVAGLRIAKTLRAELIVAPETNAPGLRGSGLIVVNPPWKLRDELEILLPALGTILARGSAAGSTLQWLAGERAA
jgi:23S rRNA (adenine2030-N6)-methyltransferase